MTTTTTDAGRWVPLAEAVTVMGRSERTLRRWVSGDKIRSRLVGGIREVWVPEPVNPAGDVPRDDTRTEGVTPDGRTSAALAVMADRSVNLAERRADELSAELVRSRRWAVTGWGAAAVLGILAAVGAVWGVRHVEGLRGQAAASDARAGVLAGVVDAERERADQVTGRVAELTGELVTATGRAEAERVRAELLADELAEARARAERAEADRLATVPMLGAADGLP